MDGRSSSSSSSKPLDFPPSLQGGLAHDAEDHRLGETGQIGPEAPGDVNRSHPEWRSAEDTAAADGDADDAGGGRAGKP